MSFHHGNEVKKFKKEHEKMYKEYKEAGMSEEAIKELFAWDFEQFKKRRKYESHTFSMFAYEFETGEYADEYTNPLFVIYPKEFSYDQKYFENRINNLMDEAYSKEMFRALKSLSKRQWQILYMYAVCGYTQKEIAEKLGIYQNAVYEQIKRIRKKFKKI